MDYELAKQLKDAGFPQRDFDNPVDEPSGGWKDGLYFPTLSELIKACGDKLHDLTNEFSRWYCNYTYCSDEYGDENFGGDSDGKTPEEAVAKLWLELNKK